MLGYNSLHHPDPSDPTPQPSGPEVLRGLQEIVHELRAKFPKTPVIIIGHTPYNDDGRRKDVSEVSKQINVEMKKLDDNKTIYFIDLSPHLTDSDGKQITKYFKDGLHLTLEGFHVWHDAMRPLFEKLIK
jgi:beta-glucosidase